MPGKGLVELLEVGSKKGFRPPVRQPRGRPSIITPKSGNRPEHVYDRDKFHSSVQNGVSPQSLIEIPGHKGRVTKRFDLAWNDYLQSLKGEMKHPDTEQLTSRQAHGFWKFLIQNAWDYGLDPHDIKIGYKHMFGGYAKSEILDINRGGIQQPSGRGGILTGKVMTLGQEAGRNAALTGMGAAAAGYGAHEALKKR